MFIWSKHLWEIGIKWNPVLDIHNMIIEAANRYSHNFMMDIILTGCWSIWEQRNDAIFKGIYPDVHRCINRFKSLLMLNITTCIELNLALGKTCNHG
jgi:hypothetical protein